MNNLSGTAPKREPKREPRGRFSPGSALVGLNTPAHARTSCRGVKRSRLPRFRPSPTYASASASILSESSAAQREPKCEPTPVADCSALKNAVDGCKSTLPVLGPGENTVKPRVCANARGTKRLKPAEAAHKTLTLAETGRLLWRVA
jgi:hypothetical protein